MIQLTVERMTTYSRALRPVKSLYLSAFPREERVPFPILMRRAQSDWVHFLLFYDGGLFCGLAYLLLGEHLGALMYLAVNDSLRSRGYGTRILSAIRDYCGDRTVALDIEQVIPGATNYDQRKRRRDFYLRNGFLPSGCGHSLRGVDYEILISDSAFSPGDYAELIRRYSAGTVRMEIQRYDYSCVAVREVRHEDMDALLHLYLHLHETDIPEQSSSLSRIWNAIVSAPDYHIFVVEQDGKIVSSSSCIMIENLTHGLRPYALIENVVTDQQYRGRGFASACIEQAVTAAKKAGCYKVMLMTGAKDSKTLDFYRHNGFNSCDKTAFIRWL